MKKILITFLLFLLLLFVVYADTQIDIMPYSAFTGIPVGTNYFKGTGTVTSSSDGNWPWAHEWEKYGNSQDASELNEAYQYYYTDKEMIGFIAIQDYEVTNGDYTFSVFDFTGPVTITVSTPNGMYLESQSDPTYRRPIEIWLYPSYLKKTYDMGWPSWAQKKLNGAEYFKQITNDSPTVTVLSGESFTTKEVWFDVVLVLPGKLDASTNEVVVDGIRYKLKDADDYSCLVTITVEYGSKSKTMTIPFTGYYDSSIGEKQTIKKSSVSMNVVLNNRATNLNIDTDRGDQIDIGQVSFVGKSGTRAVIFFSSSYDAFSQGDTFKMKLDTLGVNDDLTSLNSIGFTLTVKDGSGTKDITYDGTTYAQSSWQLSNFSSDKFIILASDNSEMRMVSYGEGKTSRTWEKYDSQIILELENNDFTMISGRYEGEIYVHVLTVE